MLNVAVAVAPCRIIPASQFAETLLPVGMGVLRFIAQDVDKRSFTVFHVAGEYK
jgi:hypothetical protein